MKILQKNCIFTRGLAVCAGLLAFISAAQAHPYASGITNNAGTIYFILNESNSAVTVTLTNNGSGQSATLIASAGASALPSTVGTNVGTQFFSMTQGATTYVNYSIKVTKTGSGVVAQTSLDANTNNQYFGPRGVAVNQNPGTKNFGRIYVAEASPGSSTITGVGTGRTTVGKGWHVLNADQSDVLGYGLTAQAAGVPLSSTVNNLTYSPFKCFVGADDFLYGADANTNTANIWQINPDLTASTQLLSGLGLAVAPANVTNSGTASGTHGRTTAKPYLTGLSSNNLVLYTIDADLNPPNQIQQYSIGGSALPYSGAPTQLGDTGTGQGLYLFDLANTGSNFYVSVFRSVDTLPAIKIYDSTGTSVVWDSLSHSLNAGHDPFVLTEGMSISPDGNYLATERQDSTICVVKLVNGIPDLTTLVTNISTIAGTTGRAAAWDAADNFYIASGGVDRLRVFTMGLSSTAITSGDTTGTGGDNHGTFQFIIPQTGVSVVATTPLASQNHGSPIAGVFTFTRTGGTLSVPLTVNFALTGTATNGADYTLSPVVTTNITFTANQATVTLSVNPVVDSIPRLTNSAVVTLQNSTTYTLPGPSTATVLIQNTGPQLLKVTSVGAASAYKPFTNDYASFNFSRYGDVSVADYTATNFTLGGTATVGADYAPLTVVVSNGAASGTAGIFSLANGTAYTGNKTVTAAFASDPTAGPGYTGSTNSATLTIIDNAEPAAMVLYSNSLSDASDSVNWSIKFASTNDPSNLTPDYDVEFGYNLAGDSLGLPPNGSPTGLKVSCNKNGAGASSGVNVYLNGQNFSGDYAVRFNMNLVQGFNTNTSTEGALFGINHSGAATNWWGGDISTSTFHGPWAADGIWWWVDSDPGGAGAGDVLEYTGTNNTYPNTGWTRLAAPLRTAFPNAFKNVPLAPATTAPYSVGGNIGMPANHATFDETTWSDVEMKQVKNVVTLSINKTPLTVYTNTTIWTNGVLMLGYDDPFASLGLLGAVYYSNLRVVRLGPPSITAVAAPGATVNITFLTIDGDDTPASFAVQSSATVNGTYTDVSPAATITQSGQTFQATVAQSGSARFYRIRHK